MTSGYYIPIYNDNRKLLFYPKYRRLIANGLQKIIKEEKISYDIIAGVATGGISHATSLANKLDCPFIYVRDKAKGHGLHSKIEGMVSKDLQGQKVIVIEDLISTGGSSARAVEELRSANGVVEYCISIFNYCLDKSQQLFDNMDPKCEVRSLLTYDVLLDIADKGGYLDTKQIKLLKEWRKDPFGWGDKHGFPRVKK
ncbi:MAG: orotate phosphoribosyltransferase [Nanoarchaeota archaeon]|nr:orotate phosphoribosyltransferase [Nanoarchaeota archaeon]